MYSTLNIQAVITFAIEISIAAGTWSRNRDMRTIDACHNARNSLCDLAPVFDRPLSFHSGWHTHKPSCHNFANCSSYLSNDFAHCRLSNSELIAYCLVPHTQTYVIQEDGKTNCGRNCFAEPSILFLDIWLKELMKSVERRSRHSEGALKVCIAEELRIKEGDVAPMRRTWVDVPF